MERDMKLSWSISYSIFTFIPFSSKKWNEVGDDLKQNGVNLLKK